MHRLHVRYATSSEFKKQEIAEILASTTLDGPDGKKVAASDAFDIEFPSITTDEPLERDLKAMVRHKVRSAYRQIMMPCIVEHAGLIFTRFERESYPGGLTQPMWDALQAEEFLASAKWAGPRIIARAVVGYCDGLGISTFVGDTAGALGTTPRGSRQFYWDTVFCPDGGGGKTYAEIAEGTGGLSKKMELSQSSKAMRQCLQHLLVSQATMFPDLR